MSPKPGLPAGRAAVIEVQADIRRPAEQVFDYASDPANEPEWNLRMTRLEKLTSGPVGIGARYRMQFTQGPAAISECMRFQRPQSWEHAGESAILTSTFGGRVVPAGNGCRLRLRMQIRPRGLLRLALPLLRRRMQRELERDVAAIKARMDGTGPGAPGTPAAPG